MGQNQKRKMKQDAAITVTIEGEGEKEGTINLRIFRSTTDHFCLEITHFNGIHLPIESSFWLTKEGITKLGTQCSIAPFAGDEEEK